MWDVETVDAFQPQNPLRSLVCLMFAEVWSFCLSQSPFSITSRLKKNLLHHHHYRLAKSIFTDDAGIAVGTTFEICHIIIRWHNGSSSVTSQTSNLLDPTHRGKGRKASSAAAGHWKALLHSWIDQLRALYMNHKTMTAGHLYSRVMIHRCQISATLSVKYFQLHEYWKGGLTL